MKCDNCGQFFSDTVFPLHIQRCKSEPELPVENGTEIIPEAPVVPENAPLQSGESKEPELPVEKAHAGKKLGKKK